MTPFKRMCLATPAALHDPNIRLTLYRQSSRTMVSAPMDGAPEMQETPMMSFRPLSTTARFVTVAATSCALVAGASVVGVTAANAATPTTTPTASSTATPATPKAKVALDVPFRALNPAGLRQLVGKLPTALKTDLKALKGKKGADRRQAVEAIETKALSGGYGTEIQGIATKAEAAWKSAPTALKTDLKSLKGMDRTQRVAELKKIEAKALAGGYGSSVESYAKGLQAAAAKRAAAAAAPSLGAMV
ncbi:hypothetical protein [Frondihabitans sp. PAMC 28766]|uniref:hypothetical protein n=1 Tax=Frondihabitans sp. PAMC 28766 TaxID=1795630 RepID=UPI0012FFA593|nr:hypothetical protein [Frondihabitans sp. PAMC 28766]